MSGSPPGGLAAGRRISTKNHAHALHSIFAPSRIYLRSRTRHVPIRAEDAAIVVYRLQHPSATLALIKVLARVLVHAFAFVMAAPRTHYLGYQLNHDWPRIGKKEGAPRAAASSLPCYSRQRAERLNQQARA